MKLEKCPFCGKKPKIRVMRLIITKGIAWDICCPTDDCILSIAWKSYMSKKDAIQDWNRRVI